MDETTRNKILPYLGKAPDARIGKKYGVTRQRVGQLRKEEGIPPYVKKENRTTPLCAAVSNGEHAQTSKAAKKVGMNLSEYTRAAILKKNEEVLGG